MNIDNAVFCGFPLPSDYEELKRILKDKKEINRADSRILDSSRRYNFDFEKPGILKNGTLTTNVDGLRYDCLVKRHETKKLYVFLHGGRWIGKGDLADIPSFSKWQYYPIIDGNMLCIEDPMYNDYEDLVTGWFYGTAEHNYRESTAKLILKIAELMQVKNEDIVIFSSRAGTSASIHIGTFIKKCTVVAIDPVIDLVETKERSDFVNITGIDLKERDKFSRNDLTNLLLDNKDVYIVLLCNILSKDIFSKQIMPLCESVKMVPKMGFNSVNNTVLWLYEAPGAPNPINSSDDEDLFRMIIYTVNRIKHNDTNDDTILCDMVNSIWYSHYRQKRKLHELRRNDVS